MNELKEKLIKAAEAFYNGQPLLMTDQEYDELEKKVKELEPDFEVRKYIVFHQNGVKQKHSANFYEVIKKTSEEISMNDMSAQCGGSKIFIPKWDGSSIVAYYRDGKPYMILSKSDKDYGISQYDKLINKVIQEVPKEITEVYYEALVKGDRSKANGLINSKYLQEEVDELLHLEPFGCFSPTDKEKETLFLLEHAILLDENSAKSIMDTGFHSSGYPCDGIVCNDPKTHRVFIRKIYNNGSAITTIKDHEITFSQTTGTYAIVLNLEPVFLDGARIKKVKQGPFLTVKNAGLGIGAKVEVVRANKVIPHIIKVLEKSDDFSKALVCDKCGKPRIVLGSDLICSNEYCETSYNWLLNRFCNSILGKDVTSIITNLGEFNKEGVKKYIQDHPIDQSKITFAQISELIRAPRFNPNVVKDEDQGRIDKLSTIIEKMGEYKNFLRSKLQRDHYDYIIKRLNVVINDLF